VKRKPRRQQVVTLLLSIATAVALMAVLYFALTSLPYLASAPTSDERFGAINACLMRTVPQRVGFAVGGPRSGVVTWNDRSGSWCQNDGGATVLPVEGIVDVALSSAGVAWLATHSVLLRIEPDGGVSTPLPLVVAELASSGSGVVALEGERLLALSDDGAVLGAAVVGPVAGATLLARPQGDGVLVRTGSRVQSFFGPTLKPTADLVPCEVLESWLLPGPPVAAFRCSGGWAVRLELSTGQLEQHEGPLPAPGAQLTSQGLVVSCDGLPCSVP
jgi:hypothetical protein